MITTEEIRQQHMDPIAIPPDELIDAIRQGVMMAVKSYVQESLQQITSRIDAIEAELKAADKREAAS